MSLSAEELIAQDRWIEAVDFVKNSLTVQPHINLITKIIYDKSFRPNSLVDQARVLTKISELDGLPLGHRLGAITAYSHKVMESMQFDAVDNAISIVESNLKSSDLLHASKNIREDRTHVKFSMYSVLFHLHLFLGNIDSYFDVGDQIVHEYELWNKKDLTSGIYQSCTNMVRGFCASFLRASSNLDEKRLDYILSIIEEALWLGITHSDDHKVKFKEYLDITYLYHIIKRNKKVFYGVSGDRRQYNKAFLELAMFSIRSHGTEKVQHIQSNLKRYLGEA